MIKRILFILLITGWGAAAFGQGKNLKLVFIRHAEKPDIGDNLSCAGFNRSLKLPEVLKAKIGLPDHIYVPAMHQGKSTARVRMFQTISPFAVKYNLSINSNFEEEDDNGVAKELTSKKGTILIVWEHNQIKPLLKALGMKVKDLQWPDSDFDSIWIVTFKKSKPSLTMDREGITPAAGCSF
ncbi:histidine phosphatase family protein [Mucilaginibacter sp. SJ]|uniref:histidine phosphatase family protein n=1 Tax=Mucilaginibacter sp. SJ TaxID=3029053 RepID=UPI0023A93D53|nr:histidine phosphatase family protein [Mucilaginibacter sp. SJ]WEA03930.1 histidine phosphatase family protein [Mucilaginibacter sp. SJ]